MRNGSNQFDVVETDFCNMCGSTNGDWWETNPARICVLSPVERFGDRGFTWTLCDECSEGIQNTSLPRPESVHLMAQIRLATPDDQQAVLESLTRKIPL